MESVSPPLPALDLSSRLHHQFMCILNGLLPPLIDDTSEALRTRNHAAIAKVAAPAAELWRMSQKMGQILGVRLLRRC